MKKIKHPIFAAPFLILASACVAPGEVGEDLSVRNQSLVVAGSPGCGSAAPTGGDYGFQLGVFNRKYILELPPNYDPHRPYPLIFAFHGAGSNAEGFRSDDYGGLAPAVGNDAVVVYGQAKRYFPPLPFPEVSWLPTLRMWDSNGSGDLNYFDTILEEVSSTVCIDPERVFATGHSSGGHFSNRLGCLRGDKLRAIAPLAGAGPSSADRGVCVGQVAAWIEHGAQDANVDVNDGALTRDYWAEINGCTKTNTFQIGSETCTDYVDCDGDYPVTWCVDEQGGHEARPEFTGPTSWAFFAGLPASD